MLHWKNERNLTLMLLVNLEQIMRRPTVFEHHQFRDLLALALRRIWIGGFH